MGCVEDMIPSSQVSLSPKNRGYMGVALKKTDLAKFGQIWPFLWWHYDKNMHFRKKNASHTYVSMSKFAKFVRQVKVNVSTLSSSLLLLKM